MGKSPKKIWLFRLAALLLGVVLAEAMLSVGGMVSPRLHYALSPPGKRETAPDEVLGFRMSPFYPGNDRQGYRNKSVPDRCDVLAVGASLTYGFAAPPDKTWPQQLEGMIGKSVYNMSCGGYGPCEFAVLVERGLRLTPTAVVVQMYPSNALARAYQSVYLDGRFPDLRTQEKAVLAELARAEEASNFAALAKEATGAGERTGSGAGGNPVKSWLKERCALYAVGRGLYALIGGKQTASILGEGQAAGDAFEMAGKLPNRAAFADPRVRTVFPNTKFHQLGVNLEDPRIREGKRISETVLESLQGVLKSKSIRLVILIIPSKPVVYEHLAQKEPATLPASLVESVKREGRLLSDLEGFCKSHGIESVNALEGLRGGLEHGPRIYPESDDEHLNADGYKVLATVVAEHLK
jgi:hypothetical protein